MQDDEPLQRNTVHVCGGGVGGSLTLPDLPLPYTLGYEKTNGCPITVRALSLELRASCMSCVTCGVMLPTCPCPTCWATTWHTAAHGAAAFVPALC